jgi:hypothetical protein
MDTSALLDLETKSARVSATLDHRPQLASIWRQCVSLSEAGANLSLEDVPVAEGDILDLMLGEIPSDGDPQATRIAEAVYRALLSPGYMLSDPGYVFDRAHRAGRMSSLVDAHKGGRASYPEISHDPDWIEARDLFVRGAPRLLRGSGPISLKAISVAALLSEVAPERHPIAERIVMMSAESFLRQDLSLRDPIISSAYKQIASPTYAYWTLPPSLALSVGSFRAWSPGTPKGQAELISGLARTMQREAGRIGKIHAWMDKAKTEFVGTTRKSSKAAFVDLIITTPVLDAPTAMRALKVSDKTARNLLVEAQETGIVSELSSRRSYRVWGITPIKDILKERVTTAELRRNRPVEARGSFPQAQPTKRPLRSEEDFESRLDDILSGLDDIMAATNNVLDKYVTRRTEKHN